MPETMECALCHRIAYRGYVPYGSGLWRCSRHDLCRARVAARDDDPLLWSVDRSWGRVRANQDGALFDSDQTKYHVDRGDSTAKCSRRILLNSIDGTTSVGFAGDIYADQPAGRASEVRESMICRRCVPKPTSSGSNR